MEMELSDRAEEILEHLYARLVELRQPPTDLGPLREADELHVLRSLGLVNVEPQGVTLTATGRVEAEHCLRRHRLAERLVHDIFDSPDQDMHAASCKFEHGLHHGLEEKVCTMLGHPRTCPHGKPIPPGECCRRLETEPGQIITTLAEAPLDRDVVVAYLQSEEVSDLRKLMAIGALPGTTVRLLQRFPSYLLRIGHSQFAIDTEMARQVCVRHVGTSMSAKGGGRRRRQGRR